MFAKNLADTASRQREGYALTDQSEALLLGRHCKMLIIFLVMNQNQNCLLVTRQNDNHSPGPGPGPGRLVPSSKLHELKMIFININNI